MNQPRRFFSNDTNIKVVRTTQKQGGEKDCGHFNTEFATNLDFGFDISATIFDQPKMRLHLARKKKLKL